MRIANWNVARVTPRSSARMGLIEQWVARIDADVWVLTETHDSVVPAGFFGVATIGIDRSSADGERWVTRWSRWPLERIGSINDETRCVAARVLYPEGAFLLCGAVLPWIGSEWRGVTYRDGAFPAALEAYAEDWRALREQFAGEAMIVAGDFNQDLVTPHYYGSHRNRELLQSALASAGLEAVTAGEGDPVRKASAPHATIDHVCVSIGDWDVGSVTRWPQRTAPDRSVSDHFGIAVELVMRSERRKC